MALSRPKSDLVDFQPDLQRAESFAEHGPELSRISTFPARDLMDEAERTLDSKDNIGTDFAGIDERALRQRFREVHGTDAATRMRTRKEETGDASWTDASHLRLEAGILLSVSYRDVVK